MILFAAVAVICDRRLHFFLNHPDRIQVLEVVYHVEDDRHLCRGRRKRPPDLLFIDNRRDGRPKQNHTGDFLYMDSLIQGINRI